MKVLFNINIDTVVLHFDISSKIVNLDGWWQKKNKKKEKIYTKKTELAYYSCNVTTFYLTVKLSPQKLKRGTNEKDYNWLNPMELIDIRFA